MLKCVRVIFVNRILVIGCPGSGKSTFSRRLSTVLSLPILHLDYIYHIDNFNQISQEAFLEKITAFCKKNDQFIIDGNYTGSLEYRIQYADTVILFDIDTKTCVSNALKRLGEPNRGDMAPGFDHTKMDDDFIDFIETFNERKFPEIKRVLSSFRGEIIIFHNYEEMEEFLEKRCTNGKI
jgi:adenylate kinase family enzyme